MITPQIAHAPIQTKFQRFQSSQRPQRFKGEAKFAPRLKRTHYTVESGVIIEDTILIEKRKEIKCQLANGKYQTF